MIPDYISHSEKETFDYAEDFAEKIIPGDIIALFGYLGSGKTIFAKGLCKGLGVQEPVHSPTFVIVNEYEGYKNGKTLIIRHCDFYRINTEKDIAELGIEEMMDQEDYVVIAEWSERIEKKLPQSSWRVYFEKRNEQERQISIRREL